MHADNRVPGIFLHITKTAGTSLVTEMRWHYGNEACASHYDHAVGLNDYTMEHEFFQHPEKVADYAALPFISGHFGFNFCERFMDKRYAFTFLRNPADRLISFYYFCKYREETAFPLYRTAQQTSFDDFLDLATEQGHWLRFWLWNHQTWSLACGNFAPVYKTVDDFSPEEMLRLATEHAQRLDYVGFVESFQEDKQRILAALGIREARVHEAVNRTQKRPRLEELPASTRKRLARLTELDDELYRRLHARRKAAAPQVQTVQTVQQPVQAVQAVQTVQPVQAEQAAKPSAKERTKGMNIIRKYLPTYRQGTVDALQQQRDELYQQRDELYQQREVLQQQTEVLQQQTDSVLRLLQQQRCAYLDLLTKVLCGMVYKDPSRMKGKTSAFAEEIREHGWDWPLHAHTMIGFKRLHNVRQLMESVLGNNIPGDVIETGVWRGGASIMMRAVLQTYGVQDRTVYVADSFAGLPPPDVEHYPADAGSDFHEHQELAVSLETVRENFAVYGLLDAQVVFVQGWFKDTLPALNARSFALLRLDGDMYESTMDALVNLYDKLSEGGYVIIDDYHVVPACRQAVHDFCAARNICPLMEEIDGVGVYWKKQPSGTA